MENPLLRSTVFTCLLDVMPVEFGQLEQAPRDLAGLVITEVCQIVEAERPLDIYVTCQEYARRVTPEDREPGYLTRYAEGLLAQQEQRDTDRRQQQSPAYTAVAGSEQRPERRGPQWPSGSIYER